MKQSPTVQKKDTEKSKRRAAPATTLEGRENQLISLAVEVAEEQLRQRTASSQVIAHFLKLGTTTAQLEKEKLRQENLLLQAKTDAIRSSEDSRELLEKALTAFTTYSGGNQESEYED